MKERTHYRSKIDELVCKSGLSGSAIAREMSVTTNRIIALRRATDSGISTDDMDSCRAAIKRLGGIISTKAEDDMKSIKFHLKKVFEILGESGGQANA